MNGISAIDLSSLLLHLNHSQNFSSTAIEGSGTNDFINSRTTTITTTTTTTTTSSIIITTTTNILHRLLNTTRTYQSARLATTISSVTSSPLKKYFLFPSSLNRKMRIGELCILSLTLPLYAIVFILFIELSCQCISSHTNSSSGSSRNRTQRRRQRIRSLIWTSNYLLVDFLGLLYEMIYVIIHLSGLLELDSLAGRFYCQIQAYLPLYLTALMAYSLTAISIYRRRHFVNYNNQTAQSTNRSAFLIIILWIMPVVTSLIPAYLLTYLNILRITQHELTNECQISYTYGSTVAALYMCYRLANIFLLPLSISFACYLTICIDLIRMQRRFTRTFKRHVNIRQNLILQILFLFLNFAVFWLPAEIITLYTKSRLLRDTVQITKSLNILLDPLIITGFDTRYSSAARRFLSKARLDEFLCFTNSNRQSLPLNLSIQLTKPRAGTTIERWKQTTLKRSRGKAKSSQHTLSTATWNMVADDDITVLESTPNHLSTVNEQKAKKQFDSSVRRKQQQQKQQRRRRQLQPSQQKQQKSQSTAARSDTKRRPSRSNQIPIRKSDNHIKGKPV